MGARIPGKFPTVFAIPSNVPAKEGLMSTLVILKPTVETPQKPNVRDRRVTAVHLLVPAKHSENKHKAAPRNPENTRRRMNYYSFVHKRVISDFRLSKSSEAVRKSIKFDRLSNEIIIVNFRALIMMEKILPTYGVEGFS